MATPLFFLCYKHYITNNLCYNDYYNASLMYKNFTNAADYEYYTVSQNNVPPLTCYNLYIHSSIATIFGTNVAEKVGN